MGILLPISVTIPVAILLPMSVLAIFAVLAVAVVIAVAAFVHVDAVDEGADAGHPFFLLQVVDQVVFALPRVVGTADIHAKVGRTGNQLRVRHHADGSRVQDDVIKMRLQDFDGIGQCRAGHQLRGIGRHGAARQDEEVGRHRRGLAQ